MRFYKTIAIDVRSFKHRKYPLVRLHTNEQALEEVVLEQRLGEEPT